MARCSQQKRIMRKTLLLTIALLLSTITFAQTFVDENFNGSELPSGWSTSEVGASNWKISLTRYAGGDGNELKLAWDPKFEGITRLITKAYDLSETNEITVSFKHFFDNFKDNEFTHTIGIATSSDEGETWNVGWSQKYTLTGVYDVKVDFTTSDMGKDNVIFCLFYEGISANMDNWFFDDLMIYKQSEFDLRIVDIDIPNIIETGEREISFSVENLGLTTVESFEAKIKASNWESEVTATFEQSIANAETALVTFKDKTFNAIARNKPYLIYVEIISINGNKDQNASNDYLEKSINVAFNKTQRIPMIEHFSSSTCGPCVAVNQQMHTLTSNNEGKFTYTKFPTSGDPYNNFEASYRVSEYGVTGVPNIFLDGRSQGSNYLTQELLDERYNTPAYADIRGAFYLEGDNIYVTADFMSYITLNNVVAYITVNEKTTRNNTGSNGETEFHHILMRMLKSKTGNPVSINAGQYQRLEFSHNMSLTNVEELNDLEVALWLQNPETKEIYNSIFAYPYTEHCYPIQNLTLTENTLSWEAPEKGTPTSYKVYINGKLASENESELSYSFNLTEETFTAEVIAVYENGKTSVGVAKVFGEVEDPISIEAPHNITANPISESSISLTWNPVAYAISYNIYRDTLLIHNTSETNYIDEGLENDTEYCYTIASVFNDTIISELSKKVYAKTLKSEQPGDEPEQPEEPGDEPEQPGDEPEEPGDEPEEPGDEPEEPGDEPEQPGEGVEEFTSSFRLYPNPANDKLYIETQTLTQTQTQTLTQTLTVEIYDIFGRQQSTVNGQQSTVIDVSNLNAGIYFIKINTKEGNIVKQFIKQ